MGRQPLRIGESPHIFRQPRGSLWRKNLPGVKAQKIQNRKARKGSGAPRRGEYVIRSSRVIAKGDAGRLPDKYGPGCGLGGEVSLRIRGEKGQMFGGVVLGKRQGFLSVTG
jgi:hypothetical protein